MYTPEGKLDSVFDAYGNRMILNDITTDENDRLNRTNNQRGFRLCQPGYFDLYFETGSGFESNTQQHIDRRAILCQVFQDISNFIISPLTQNPTQRVCIWIRDFDILNPNNSASAILSQGSSYFCLPPTPGNQFQIADGEVFKTIISGQNSYNSVNAALGNLAAINGENSSYFFHGYMAFNKTFQWNTNLAATTITTFDLYSAALKEAMHVLGFQSLMRFDGTSVMDGNFRYFSRYDTFLRKNNVPLLTGNGTCPLTGFNFNTSLSPAYNTLISATSNTAFPPQNNTNSDVSNCNNSITYVSSFNQTVFTPLIFEPRFSLSHFDDNCQLPVGVAPFTGGNNDRYFVTSNRNLNGTNGIKRIPQSIERRVLCDIGYNVGTTFRTTSYAGGICTRNTPGGINDGLGANFNYTINSLVGGPQLAPIAVLANDVNATTIACANLVFGNGIVAITGANTTITYTPAPGTQFTQGLHLISYVPFSASNQPGNLTYVFIYVSDPACTATNCNLVQNSSFENGFINSCGFLNSVGGPNFLSCWSVLGTSADLFNRVCTNDQFFNINVNTQNSIPAANDWTGGNNPANDKFIGIAAGVTNLGVGATELVQTFLSTPLILNQQYRLTVRAAVNNNVNIVSGGVTMNSNIATPLLFAASPNVLTATPYGGTTFSGVTPIRPIGQTNQVTFSIPPQAAVAGNTSIVWTLYNLDFTYNGAVPANNLIIALNPSLLPIPVVTGSRQPAYVFIDDVSITPIVGPMQVLPANPTIYQGAGVLLTASPGNNVNWAPNLNLSNSVNSNTTTATPSSTQTYTATGSILNCAVGANTTINVIPCSYTNTNNLPIINIGIGTPFTNSSQLVGGAISNSFVNLLGDFTINSSNFSFNGCLVYCAPGTRIRNNSQNILISNTIMFSCFQMWRGIENEGFITMVNSTIQDAQYGISFMRGGGLSATNSNFFRNFVGLRWIQNLAQLATNVPFLQNVEFNGITNQPNQGPFLLPMYPNQTPVTRADRPHAGIWMDDVPSSLVLNNTVRFRNLTNGIISDGNNIDLNGTNFININSVWGGTYAGLTYGLPITQTGGFYSFTGVYIRNANLVMTEPIPTATTFSDCHKAIVGENAGLNVDGVNIFNGGGQARFGIISAFNVGRSVFITNNNINTISTGIMSFNSQNAVNVEFRSNVINISGGNSKGILVSTAGAALNHSIKFNTITLNPNSLPGIAIDVQAATSIKIEGNTIQLNNVNADGIWVKGSPSASIRCNLVTGLSTANVNKSGIRIDLSPTTTVAENFVQSVPRGFQFNGNNGQVNFELNRMLNHRFGLYIGISSSVGLQENKGNLWGGSYVGGNPAKCDGIASQSIFQNVIGTSTCVGTNYNLFPLTILPVTGWFIQYSGPNPLTQCEPCGGRFTAWAIDFDTKVASINLLDSVYNETYTFMSRKELLRKMHTDSLGVYQAPLFTDFYESMANAPEKEYIFVDSLNNNLINVPSKADFLGKQLQLSLQMNVIQQIDSLLIITNDSLTTTNLYEQRKIENEALNTIREQEELFKTAFYQEIRQKTFSIALENDATNPNGLSAQYEKRFNEIYLDSIALGLKGLNEMHLAALQEMAYTCPLLGGIATYKARSVLYSFNDSLVYNDEAMCMEQGLMFKMAQENKTTANQLKIYPNPANTLLNISLGLLGTDTLEEVSITFLNIAGQIVKESIVNPLGQSKISIDISKLSSGIYFVEVKTISITSLIQKCIIQHND